MSNLRKNNARKVMTTSAAAALAATAIAPAVASADSHTFPDVSADNPNSEAIEALAKANILEGDENGNFNPEDSMNRAQAAKMVAKLIGAEPSADAENPFDDIEGTKYEYATEHATALSELGVIEGDGEGNFMPGKQLERAELAKMVVLAYDLELEAGYDQSFDDVDEQEWYSEYVSILHSHDLIKGVGDNKFAPEDDMQRQHFALLSYDADKEYGSTIGEPELAVESVSANNLKEVTVEFSHELDEATAEDENNYSVGGETPEYATLSEDGKTVMLTKADADVTTDNQSTEEVTVENVEDTEGMKVEDFEGEVNFTDTTIPEALSATLVGPTTVAVEFSEPVDDTTVGNTNFVVDGNSYSVSNASVSPVDHRVVTFEVPSSLDEGDHDVTVQGDSIEDFAGFEVEETDLTFNKTVDEEAPVASVKSASDSQVVLEFDENVMNADDTINTNVEYYHTYDGVTNYQGTVSDVTGNEVTVDFPNNPLPEGEVSLYVSYDDEEGTKIEDAWGNEMDEVELTANVEVDREAPEVDDIEVVSNQRIDVTYSESVKNGLEEDNYSFTDANDDDVAFSLVYRGDNTYSVMTDTELAGGNYNLAIEGIVDDSRLENEMSDYSNVIQVDDEIAPTVNNTADFNDDGDKIFVYFSEGMNDTVTNVNNYRYADGSNDSTGSLPEGTTIEQDTSSSVIITLPEANTDLGAAGTDYEQLLVGQVEDLEGNATENLETVVDLSAADIGKDNTVMDGVSTGIATSTRTVEFTVDRALSAVDVDQFEFQHGTNTTAEGVIYENNADGTSTVTVTAPEAEAWGTDEKPELALSVGALEDLNGVENSTFTFNTGDFADGIAPTFDSAKAIDDNSNNQVDEFKLTFSENLYSASVQESDFNVEGYTISRVDVSNDVVTLNVDEKDSADLDAEPTITLTDEIEDEFENSLEGDVEVDAESIQSQQAGVSSEDNTTLSANDSEIVADATSTTDITVQAVDANGDNLTSGGDNVTMSTDNGSLGAVTDNSDGTYTATLTSSADATQSATVSASINGNAITTGDASVDFVPGDATAADSTISATDSEIVADGTSTTDITVQAVDANGNNLTSGGDNVTLSTDNGTVGDVTDNGDGSYTATLTSTADATQSATVSASINGSAITSGDASVDFVAGGVDATNSDVTTTANTGSADLTITVQDANSNPITGLTETDFSANIDGAGHMTFDSIAELGNVTDNNDGTYSVTYTDNAATYDFDVNADVTGDDVNIKTGLSVVIN